jgi:hypothetical protein
MMTGHWDMQREGAIMDETNDWEAPMMIPETA